ncbi:hypothetical protein TrLO_g6199 [Triparma laevis f. longispina]|uniref:Uncharacterized protein n=1 Tax=Triparma laevis f. longispina TaxID=1714387 RepID=A0A9W7FUQ3_9STRA|nr:hypothetical protein TrLO_g6199 [Triparma laevis f. longispina]
MPNIVTLAMNSIPIFPVFWKYYTSFWTLAGTLLDEFRLNGLKYYLSIDTTDTSDTSDTNITDYANIFKGYSEDICLDSVDTFIANLAELMETAFTNWLKTYAEVMESKDYATENTRFDKYLKEYLGKLGIGVPSSRRTLDGLFSLVKPVAGNLSTLRQGLKNNLHSYGEY